MLERGIADRGRYPAINILRSISRMLPDCNSAEENQLIGQARKLMAAYDDMADMIRLGAYRRGSDPDVDQAIHYHPALEAFLSQGKDEHAPLADGYRHLQDILAAPTAPAEEPAPEQG